MQISMIFTIINDLLRKIQIMRELFEKTLVLVVYCNGIIGYESNEYIVCHIFEYMLVES